MLEFKSYKPHIKLQKWIKSYWLIDYNKLQRSNNKNIIIMPYDNICLLFIVNSENEFGYDNKSLKNGIYICPPSLDKQNLDFNSNLYYIDVSLYPGVFYKLFKIPVTKLENRLYEIDELSLNFDLSILEEFYKLKNNTFATLNLLDNYLFKLFKNMEDDVLLSNILELTKNHNLNNFYNQNTLSMRQIQRNVREYTGMTPKSIERINKFYSTLKVVKSNKSSINYKEIAIENNYYDQPAFIKEFNFFTGYNPTLFLMHAEEFLQFKCNIFS